MTGREGRDSLRRTRDDGDAQAPCEGIRAGLIDAVMGPGEFRPDSLDLELRVHPEGCAECRAFLDDIIDLKQAANQGYAAAEAEIEVKSGQVTQAIQAAVEEGLARREAERARRGSASLLERVGFLVFAAAVLAVQTLLFRKMRLSWFLALEAGLNWVAPIALYVAVALFWRPARQRREEVR